MEVFDKNYFKWIDFISRCFARIVTAIAYLILGLYFVTA